MIGARRPRHRLLLASMLLAPALVLTGCSTVESSLDSGRELVDSAQGLVQAATDVAAACTAAQAAWVPGVTPDEARAALEEAAALLEEPLAAFPDAPGVQDVSGVLDEAQASLADGGDALGISQESLQTACALVTAGG